MIENRCIRCGKQLADAADPNQFAQHVTFDVASGAGPFCGAGCMELARRGIPAMEEMS